MVLNGTVWSYRVLYRHFCKSPEPVMLLAREPYECSLPRPDAL